MKSLQIVFASMLVLVFSGCNSIKANRDHSPAPQVDFSLRKVAFQIGETKVHAQVRQFGRNKLTMVNVHDDENACVEAGVAVLEKIGGRLIELTHSGERRVAFQLGGRKYSFDPNRIFSRAGVKLTVQGEGEIPLAAQEAVNRFAAQFIRYFKLDKATEFITLHNNGESGLSIHTYEPGGDWAADTDELFVAAAADPDDFYFVTDKKIFHELKKRNFNVILQDNSIQRDDGSLSVFAGRHGIRYINVEAEDTHGPEQIRMIENAVEVLAR